MVDLHHHLLFGLDDGSPDLDTSIAMARMAAADGITHVVATPHSSSSWTFNPPEIAARLATLRQALAAQSIPLTLGSGCDFHLSYENVADALANPKKYTINATDYLLVELPDFSLPPQLSETFYELRLGGMVPILTHPERNPTLQRDPARLEGWLRDGLLLQVTTSSVLGQMGKHAERLAHQLLANRWVHFLATDAHNLESRPPRMRQTRDLVAKKILPRLRRPPHHLQPPRRLRRPHPPPTATTPPPLRRRRPHRPPLVATPLQKTRPPRRRVADE